MESADNIQIRVFNKDVDGATTRSFIATIDGQPIGSIDVNDWHKPGGWVSWVFVDENFRRQGIAKRLFERILADARASGKAGLGLCVKPENENAQALYQGLGFRICYTYDSGLYAMAIHL